MSKSDLDQMIFYINTKLEKLSFSNLNDSTNKYIQIKKKNYDFDFKKCEVLQFIDISDQIFMDQA